MDIAIKEKARNLVNQGEIDEAERIILQYLKDHPKDTDAWLTLALAEMTPPFEDHRLIFKWMDSVLFYDPLNAYALLILSYVHTYMAGGIPEVIFHRLDMIEDEDSDTLSMIEMAKSWYYISKKDLKNAEKALRKSIKYCNQHQTNLTKLGNLLIDQGKLEEGVDLLSQGMRNVRCILTYLDNDEIDPLCIEGFLNESLRGIDISAPNYEFIKENFEKATKRLLDKNNDT